MTIWIGATVGVSEGMAATPSPWGVGVNVGRRRSACGLFAAGRGLKRQMRPGKPAAGEDDHDEARQASTQKHRREAADGIGCRRSRGLFGLC